MIVRHTITHGLIFALIVNIYLFLMMITVNPRVWGYRDYPEIIKNKVPPQTKSEKMLAAILGLPWFIFLLGFPVLSTYVLKKNLGNEISYWIAFVNLAVLFMLANLGDLLILDWLIVSKITPKFVIIQGTEEKDYKDFSHHFRGHAKGTIVMVLLSLIIAGIVWHF